MPLKKLTIVAVLPFKYSDLEGEFTFSNEVHSGLVRIYQHDTMIKYLHCNTKGLQKIEFQPWTNLDKKFTGLPLIYEANFKNFSAYGDNFQPKNFKNPLDY